MKRFIRTKDGKIFDLQAVNHSIRHAKIRKVNNGDIEIIKEADTIEELIEVGDLVKFGGSGSHRIVSSYYFKPNKERDYTSFKDYEGVIYDTQYITELYTKQDRNYVLVAEKVDGEWRVL